MRHHHPNEQDIGIGGLATECESASCKTVAGAAPNEGLTELLSVSDKATDSVQVTILKRMPEFPSDPRSLELMRRVAESSMDWDIRVSSWQALGRDQRAEALGFVQELLGRPDGRQAFDVLVAVCNDRLDNSLNVFVKKKEDEKERSDWRRELQKGSGSAVRRSRRVKASE